MWLTHTQVQSLKRFWMPPLIFNVNFRLPFFPSFLRRTTDSCVIVVHEKVSAEQMSRFCRGKMQTCYWQNAPGIMWWRRGGVMKAKNGCIIIMEAHARTSVFVVSYSCSRVAATRTRPTGDGMQFGSKHKTSRSFGPAIEKWKIFFYFFLINMAGSFVVFWGASIT